MFTDGKQLQNRFYSGFNVLINQYWNIFCYNDKTFKQIPIACPGRQLVVWLMILGKPLDRA